MLLNRSLDTNLLRKFTRDEWRWGLGPSLAYFLCFYNYKAKKKTITIFTILYNHMIFNK